MPKRGIGDRAEACVSALAERERIPFVAALGRPDDAPGIPPRSVNWLLYTSDPADARSSVDLGGRRIL